MVENWDSGRETENLGSGIGVSDGGPGGPRSSRGGISDFDGESNLMTEPWLRRWDWSLGGEYRKSTAGTGGSGGKIVFSS